MKIRYDVQKALQKFEIETLRKPQIKPINSILDGNDTFLVAPTSSGKSLTYQLPAVMHEDQLTIVIEPTMALMHDQVQKLKDLGIRAEYVDSTLCSTEKNMIWDDVRNHRITILYVSPERLSSPGFLSAIEDMDIYMVVIDECHCVLEWGISFRPDYLEIGEFIKKLEYRPIITALTATVNPKDRKNIQKLLGMKKPEEFINSIDRPNLILMKEEFPSQNNAEKVFQQKLARLKYNIKKYHRKGSIIIYCSTRKHVDAVYNHLESKFPGEIVRCHSKMKPKTRAKHEREFLDDKKSIMVATSAFGMGIDKGDIDLIVHFDMPLSIDDYYQQAGRAGRDGSDAHCIMLYNEIDVKKWQALMKNEKDEAARKYIQKQLNQMQEFVESNSCMMQELLSYFGETKEKTCKHCTCCQRNRRR